MVFYCTNCWREIEKSTLICSYCNAKQSKLEENTFSEKLIRALNHPEPETPIRAANILAQLKMKEAVPHILKKLEFETDPFIIEAFVRASLEIDPKSSGKTIIKIFSDNPPVTIKNLINEIRKNENEDHSTR